MQMADVRKQFSLLKSEIDVAIQDPLGRPRLVREIYQICDVINHAP
jgi:hypothetical protein